MNITYEITDYGYNVLRDGALLICQSSVRGVAGTVPFADDNDKRQHAEAHVAELTSGPAAVQEGTDQPAPALIGA